VRILATVLADLRGIWRLWWGLGLGSLKVPAADDPRRFHLVT
jgi:hypothetical protein